MTALDLKAIAAHGGGLDFSARNFSAMGLKAIASHGKSSGAKLILRDAGTLTAMDMKAIAAHSPGNVTFVL